jgi:hypothetical protein
MAPGRTKLSKMSQSVTQWSEESPEGAALQTVCDLHRKATGLTDSSLRSE